MAVYGIANFENGLRKNGGKSMVVNESDEAHSGIGISNATIANSGRMCAWISGIPIVAVGLRGAKPLERVSAGQPQKYLTGGRERERNLS